MSIQPIDIKIKNNWKYGEIAFLVDRDDFLKDIEGVRNTLKIIHLIPYDGVEKWEREELDRELKKNPVKKIKNLHGQDRWLFPQTESEKIVDSLLKKYHKAPPFFIVIKYAILCGKITDDEYLRTAYCRVIYPEDYIESYQYGTAEAKITIIISPETKPKEIKEMFKKEIPEAVEEYRKYAIKSKRIPPDTISNIRRDRKWYWLKKNGLSWSNLHNKVKKKSQITDDGVRHAVEQYRDRLTMEL